MGLSGLGYGPTTRPSPPPNTHSQLATAPVAPSPYLTFLGKGISAILGHEQ
jgi:hypothetical protein